MFKKAKLLFDKESFLFSELIKRDFKQKYKRTVLWAWAGAYYPLC